LGEDFMVEKGGGFPRHFSQVMDSPMLWLLEIQIERSSICIVGCSPPIPQANYY
jgi:hypothetical protein